MRGAAAIVVAGAALIAAAASAGPPVSLPTLPGGERSFGGGDSQTMARSGGLINEWRFRQEWRAVAQSYASALRFARCARRYSPDAADDIMNQPIGHEREIGAWRQMVRQHRACVGQDGTVSPLLLRAAIAETLLREQQDGALSNLASLGVPEVVDGYPLRAIAKCQHLAAPSMTSAVLATEPGSESERASSAALYGATSFCGASRLGRVNPTVARIALIDAAWTQTGDASRAR